MTSNYSNSLYKDYEKLEKKYKELEKKYKFEKLRADVAEYENQSFEIINNKKQSIIDEKEKTWELPLDAISKTRLAVVF